ncbi:MAG TPA: valine--tRNA ligase, partial [Actinobacteria bacterium]|nr:valine--tRNA ligase [Actinomycetota bacterium]
MEKIYNPKKVEKKWYEYWENNRLFHGEIDPKKKPYSIVIPPPNVTGNLHMGHALNNTIQDIIIRKKRMEGFATSWIPGTDHAGIATQNVVEKSLAKEGKTRHDLGREKFVERVWEWKEKYGDIIINQLKALGCSCDWDRQRFTMDEGYSKAVKEVFVRLYDDGLIYRDNYIINWCPKDLTALSDIEVEHHDIEGNFWYIKYPFKDGDGYVEVATTRPETMLGDTAVAVNPTDKRFKDMIGKTVILPLLNREIPIIADDFVDPEFGTGAVKVTPAHDPNDFEIGKRHDLEQINIFTPDAKINENGGPYSGMERIAGRKKVVEDLEKQDLLIKVERHMHSVGHCYRCDEVVEPRLSLQWFVKMKPLAKIGIETVRKGNVKFTPERWLKLYYDWMENIRDWVISRQIWWGHQIPVFYCDECDETVVAIETPKACERCGGAMHQDEDVLDTWFSSALWPFVTLGWPE